MADKTVWRQIVQQMAQTTLLTIWSQKIKQVPFFAFTLILFKFFSNSSLGTAQQLPLLWLLRQGELHSMIAIGDMSSRALIVHIHVHTLWAEIAVEFLSLTEWILWDYLQISALSCASPVAHCVSFFFKASQFLDIQTYTILPRS